MTKKQKLIASCQNPYYKNLATKEEVKTAKKLARGTYWYDADEAEYCSFSPGGLRKYFSHGSTHVSDVCLQTNVFNFLNETQRKLAKRGAALWAAGYCKEAKIIDGFFV